VKDLQDGAAAASGERSITAEAISGIAVTGDGASIQSRTVVLPAGGIPRPEQVGVSAPVSNLPRAPALVFEGREEELARLEQVLSARENAVVTQVVYGLGGVGKSELALQYAHAHRGDYRLIWWITAASPGQIQAGLALLGAQLCPEIAMAGTTLDAARWGTGWLQAHGQWLLILDNVEDAGHVEALVAQLRKGHIILTTRRDTDWPRLAVPVRLDILRPGPAAEVLTRKIGHAAQADLDDAAAIADELGYLPLALYQAAAFITQTRLTLSGYLDKLRQQPARMHAARAAGAQPTIARLWDITTTSIYDHDPEAGCLLHILACYAPDAVPRSLLGAGDPAADIDERLGLLASYSMINLTTETVSIHRLVQAVVLADPRPHNPVPRETALKWLDATVWGNPPSDIRNWPLLRALVPHAECVASRFPGDDQPEALFRVLSEIGGFLQDQGAYEQALAMRESALAIAEARSEPDHGDTAHCLARLAATYRSLGWADAALPIGKRALRIAGATFGTDHPDMAIMLGNLASTYRALGRPQDALPLFRQALHVTEATLGPGHPDMAIRLANLAATYKDQGRLSDALELFERARQVTEAALGPDHPDMGIRLGMLASAYRALRRPEDALLLEQRALQITETALGPDHPDTGIRLANLAATYRDLRQPAQALPLARRALKVTEAALGPDHPAVAIRLSNLAAIYTALGRPEAALSLDQRALRITEAALGPDHPDVAIRLNYLAATYRALGDPVQALQIQQRASPAEKNALLRAQDENEPSMG
jgi:tetratricopeptide (TPR) repeat protein